MSETTKLFYSINELSAAAGVGRTTIYAEIKSGRLRPIKIGKRTVVPVGEARAWEERLRGGSDDARSR